MPKWKATAPTVVDAGAAWLNASCALSRRTRRRYAMGGTPISLPKPFCRVRTLTWTRRASSAGDQSCSGRSSNKALASRTARSEALAPASSTSSMKSWWWPRSSPSRINRSSCRPAFGWPASPGPASNSLRTMFNDSRHPPAVGEDKSMTGSNEMGPDTDLPSSCSSSVSSDRLGIIRQSWVQPSSHWISAGRCGRKTVACPGSAPAVAAFPILEIARPHTGTLTWYCVASAVVSRTSAPYDNRPTVVEPTLTASSRMSSVVLSRGSTRLGR